MADGYDLVVGDATAPTGDRGSTGIRDGRITDVAPGAENRLETVD